MAGDTPIVLEGGLTKDPEIKFAQSGKAYARFGVAVGSRKKDGDTWVDGPSAFWNCTAFGPLAEHIGDSLRKGDRVIIVGTLRPEKYTASDGTERNVVQVIVENAGPSLLFATATTTKAQRSGGQQNAPERPAERSQQGGGWNNDPWASSQDNPPF
jgi:single-strand DNA-binding protein